ncbi:hypothetical protein Poli38472_001082 [Pythium oligandrum]|uniref:Microsomal glutathione S-transferase 1 n=1 Tax=Pythium oligandrum TaxID=41045 RepID=A0A8K1FN24_PYTOL|nr:hypothetical protein Poli38472_001082 [Pythium oligandrum]|eukprot:TMW68926.1 hypothetical protein Poli38472_001082 [Pythium oligandrum]
MAYLLKIYIKCVMLLYIKFVAVLAIQASKSFEAGARPPEDKDLPHAKGYPTQNYGMYVDNEDERMRERKAVELRWKRIVLNDLESIPFALIVFGAGLFSNKTNEAVHTAALVVYTVLRFVHTIAYAKSLQPYRTVSWQLSILATIVGAVNAMISSYN